MSRNRVPETVRTVGPGSMPSDGEYRLWAEYPRVLSRALSGSAPHRVACRWNGIPRARRSFAEGARLALSFEKQVGVVDRSQTGGSECFEAGFDPAHRETRRLPEGN